MTDDGKRLDGNGLARFWQAVQAYVTQSKANDITAVNAGTGLSGGGNSGSVTLNLSAATSNTLGGVKVTYDSETQSLYISTQ